MERFSPSQRFALFTIYVLFHIESVIIHIRVRISFHAAVVIFVVRVDAAFAAAPVCLQRNVALFGNGADRFEQIHRADAVLEQTLAAVAQTVVHIGVECGVDHADRILGVDADETAVDIDLHVVQQDVLRLDAG